MLCKMHIYDKILITLLLAQMKYLLKQKNIASEVRKIEPLKWEMTSTPTCECNANKEQSANHII